MTNHSPPSPTALSDPEKQPPSPPPPNSALSPPSSSTPKPLYKSLSLLDQLLALWILLAITTGLLLGAFVPHISTSLARGTFASVSAPIAAGLLAMMYPILCKVRFEALHTLFRSRDVWRQLGFSVLVNWIVAPLFMLGLAWAFLPDESGLREGLILVGVARCIAMVLVWNQLAGGEAGFCAVLVAVNSVLQMVLFAPVAVLFIRVISRERGDVRIGYGVVARSVGVFLGIPLGAAVLTRVLGRAVSKRWYDEKFVRWISPLSLLGLIYTVIVLFASQGGRVVHQIVSVVRVSAPLIVYFGVIFAGTMAVCVKLGFVYEMAATQSFTAASNNFELAIAVAVAAYGPESDQALAATVGPLIEVPVLLGCVYGVRWWARRRGMVIQAQS